MTDGPSTSRGDQPSNLFSAVPALLSDELIEVLLVANGVRIERIVSCGDRSAEGFWYDQDRAEWVAVLKGAALVRFEDRDQPIHMRPGDHVLIPAHRRHRIEWTTLDEPTIWLAVHFAE